MDIERCFFQNGPPFLTISKPLDMSEMMFSHQIKSVGHKKPPFLTIFYLISPQGVLFCQIRVSCQTFKMDIERCFFKPPFLTISNHWTCQKWCFLIRRVLKKPFSSIWSLPRGSCFAKIRVSCQTFKMDIERCFFNPPFLTISNHWTCQKWCFLIRRVLKKPFCYLISPQGVLFCQNKSQLSNLQNGLREMLF